MPNAQLRIEAQLYRSFWDDGLLDLLCGVGLLAVGVAWWLDLFVLQILVPPILVPVWVLLRRVVVEPRAGYVEFSQARQSQTKEGLKTTFFRGVVTFLLAGTAYFYFKATGVPTDGIAYYIAGLPAALLAAGALMVAQLTAVRRFRAYALVLFSCAATTIAMGWGPAVPMLAGGVAVALSGLAFMVRFLRAAAEFDETTT